MYVFPWIVTNACTRANRFPNASNENLTRKRIVQEINSRGSKVNKAYVARRETKWGHKLKTNFSTRSNWKRQLRTHLKFTNSAIFYIRWEEKHLGLIPTAVDHNLADKKMHKIRIFFPFHSRVPALTFRRPGALHNCPKRGSGKYFMSSHHKEGSLPWGRL